MDPVKEKFKLRIIQDDTIEQTEVIIRTKTLDDEVGRIIASLGAQPQKALFCETLSSSSMIDMKDIVLISKSGRYLSVKTLNGEFILSDPLYKIEEKLDPIWFVRISQSEIVNLKHVKGWNLSKSGTIRIEMVNGIESFTSRRYARNIREILHKGGSKA